MNEQSRLPEEISSYTSKCPVCKSDILIKDYKYNVPFYGDILLSIGQCSKCGYTIRDVIPLTTGEPKVVKFLVEGPDDLNAIVIKSSQCTIEIPELGAKVEPGIYPQGYITTIEGLVHDLIDALKTMCSQSTTIRDKCVELEELFNKAASGEIKYTVVIYDPLGLCNVLSSTKKPITEKLSSSNY